MDQLVLLQGAGVSLGGRPILRDVDFGLAPGEVTGIVGPNGSGKTTLIRVLATLLGIDRGTGSVLGAELDGDEVYRIRGSIGMIGHSPTLLPELTLEENLAHVARLAGIDIARVAPSLEVVGLEEAADRKASASSFGMQRRVEVAHLLLTRPKLLLLDEATSGLDTRARELIGALIARTTDNGGGAVFVSHDRVQLEAMTQSVHTLDMGRLETAA